MAIKPGKGFDKRRKPMKKRPSKGRLKTLARQAWALMSRYVRLRDNGICYTCGEKHPMEDTQAGHYVHAPKTNAASYHPWNINAQCPKCNISHNGMLGAYEERLIEDYGPAVPGELYMAKHEGSNTNIAFFEGKIVELQQKIKEMR
jgi:5-methylcytosine-specific restriction endonuclease McrA